MLTPATAAMDAEVRGLSLAASRAFSKATDGWVLFMIAADVPSKGRGSNSLLIGEERGASEATHPAQSIPRIEHFFERVKAQN